MDLVALACQEVGLDLTEAAAQEELFSGDVWRRPNQLARTDDDSSQEEGKVQGSEEDFSQEGWQVQMLNDNPNQGSLQIQLIEDYSRQESWQIQFPDNNGSRDRHVVMPKLLSFGGDESNTVFTDQEGKESTVALQFKRSSFSEGVSPITNIYSQSKTNPKFLRRFNSSMIASSQGAPSRKLPGLPSSASAQSKPGSRPDLMFPVLEVPSLSDKHHTVSDDYPFLFLFKDNRPGQVAFAYYAIDCWASHGGSAGVPDQQEFLSKCKRWWLNLPTPYRRGYWTREVKHYKNVIRHRTWKGQAVDGRVWNVTVADEDSYNSSLW